MFKRFWTLLTHTYRPDNLCQIVSDFLSSMGLDIWLILHGWSYTSSSYRGFRLGTFQTNPIGRNAMEQEHRRKVHGNRVMVTASWGITAGHPG